MNLTLNSIRHPHKLSQMAYEEIKKSILMIDPKTLPGDERIDEKSLVELLGISRTPVREAINRLVAEGFLKLVPRKGVFVVKKSKEEMIEIIMVRATIEGMATRLATKNISKEDIVKMREIFQPFQLSKLSSQRREYTEANIRFHEFVLEKSQCKKLVEIAINLFDHMRMIRFRTSWFQERIESSLTQHNEIINLFEEGDADKVEQIMRKHIEESARYVK